MAPKVSPVTLDHLDLKEIGDQEVYPDLQEHQEFQVTVLVVSLDLQASQERRVRRERVALRGCLCQVPPAVQEVLALRVHQGSPDLQAFPQQGKTASLEIPGVPVCRAREVTQESWARKVKRETPVLTASVAPPAYQDLKDLQDSLDSPDLLEHKV